MDTSIRGLAEPQRCPCSFHGDPARPCPCTPAEVRRYLARVSGPLLDRIDLHLEVPAVPYRERAAERSGELSAAIRERAAAGHGERLPIASHA